MSGSEKIHLFGDDDHNTLQISGSVVDIYPSASSALDYDRVIASNKIKIKPAVKFFWEYQYYLGRLICRHKYTPLIAYCINNKGTGTTPSAENCSMIRLRNTDTSRKLLLKDFFGKVVTMDFADQTEPVLAVLDRSCALHVFKILPSSTSDDSYVAEQLIVLRFADVQSGTDNQSLCWCPWKAGSPPALSSVDGGIPKFNAPTNPSMLLSISCGGKMEIMDVAALASLLKSQFPSDQMTGSSESADGCCTRDQLSQVLKNNSTTEFVYAATVDHGNTITALSLSRDASCAASACLDGQVRIFTFLMASGYADDAQLSPVHTFSPHDGLPLYGLIFVDDDLGDAPRGTWRHLITGAQYNRELRLWSCADWSCLQTVRFCVADTTSQTTPASSEVAVASSAPHAKPSIIMALDYSNSLLVATDITRRVLYIFALTKQLKNEPTGAGDGPDLPGLMFTSISEFLLTTPCILFALGTCDRQSLPISECPSVPDAPNRPVDLINLEIHSIHTWHLLNGTITFELPHWTKSEIEGIAVPSVVRTSSTNVTESPYETVKFTVGDSHEASQHFGQPLSTSGAQETDFPGAVDEVGEEVDSTTVVPQVPEDDGEDLHPLRPSDFSPESLSAHPSSVNEGTDADDHLAPVDLDFPFNLTPSTFHTPKHLPDGMESTELVAQSSIVGPFEEASAAPSVPSVVPFETIEDAMRATELNPPVTDGRSPSPDAGQLDELRSEVDLLTNLLSPQNEATRNELGVPQLPERSSPDAESNIPSASAPDLQQLIESTDDASRSPIRDLKGSLATELIKSNGEKQRSTQRSDGRGGANLGPSMYLHPETNWSTMSLCSSPGPSSSSSATTPVGSDEVIQAPDSKDVQLDFSTFGDKENPRLDSNSERMDNVMELLKLLVSDSNKRAQQMDMVLNRLNQTQEQLDRISQAQVDLFKRIQSSTTNGLPSVGYTPYFAPAMSSVSDGEGSYSATSSLQSRHAKTTSQQPGVMDEGKVPEWAKQVLLQLRTQQGDYARRFSHLEGMLNKVSSSTTELSQVYKKNQVKPTGSHSANEPRLDQLPKLTCDLLKPVVRSEVQNALVNNTQRLIDPLQKVVLRAVQESLSGLPATLTENVSRLIRDKNFTNQFSRILCSTLSTELGGAYRDSLLRVFVPALEKNIQRLFQELNSVFRAGTIQYLDEIRKHSQAPSDPSVLANTICAELAPEIKNVLSASLATRADEPVIFKTDPRTTSTLRPNGSVPVIATQDVPGKSAPSKNQSPVRRNPPVKDSHMVFTNSTAVPTRSTPSARSLWTVDRGTNEGQLGVSETQTTSTTLPPKPAATLTKEEEFALLIGQAQTLISSDRLVEALNSALIPTNQALVLDVCNDIDPDKLFRSGKYSIPQNILLSLIDHLSFGDLAVQLDLKLRYLEEAVNCLNKHDPTTTQHGPRILSRLARRLDKFMSSAMVGGTSKLSPLVRNRIIALSRFAGSLFDTKPLYK